MNVEQSQGNFPQMKILNFFSNGNVMISQLHNSWEIIMKRQEKVLPNYFRFNLWKCIHDCIRHKNPSKSKMKMKSWEKGKKGKQMIKDCWRWEKWQNSGEGQIEGAQKNIDNIFPARVKVTPETVKTIWVFVQRDSCWRSNRSIEKKDRPFKVAVIIIKGAVLNWNCVHRAKTCKWLVISNHTSYTSTN